MATSKYKEEEEMVTQMTQIYMITPHACVRRNHVNLRDYLLFRRQQVESEHPQLVQAAQAGMLMLPQPRIEEKQ